jgi:glycosyltransferase involved in cell wall biosynthesis
MRLLIFTQKVDKKDSILGFFHGWITEIAKRAESVTVICLEKGETDLPKNVKVYSLGKPQYQSIARYGAGRMFVKIKYLVNLYKYIFEIRGSYDKVFVHMNQEYILLLGVYWKIAGIPVYLWRNHPKGSLYTTLSVWLSTKVFCTSGQSFTARFKKTVIMPAGVDIDSFKPFPGVVHKKYSVCMVGRITPIKHTSLALEAINHLVLSGAQVSLTIVGSPLPKDESYYNFLKKYVADNKLSSYVQFFPAVFPEKLPEIYSSHEVCLNFTDSGSFDKTIVESASCGAIPLVSNQSLSDLLPKECITSTSPETIAKSIQLLLGPREQLEIHGRLQSFVKSQSLSALMEKLFVEMK